MNESRMDADLIPQALTLTQPSSSFSPPSIPISGRKLPIKRKPPPPPPNPPTSYEEEEEEDHRPPFKFHRIWTEIDELRFLQGLLHCRNQALSFPRDLHIFYSHFSSSMPQPYSRSQLSEKLRRLRKKFRVLSSRLSRGLHPSQLSSHDRALFDLSLKLWHPDFSSISPFGRKKIKNRQQQSSPVMIDCGNSNSVSLISVPNRGGDGDDKVRPNFEEGWRGDFAGDLNFQKGDDGLNEVKIEGDDFSETLHRGVVRSVMDVFDGCVGEIIKEYGCKKSVKIGDEQSKMVDFRRRWRDQQISELDVLCGRLRLVLEDAIVHS